MYLQKQIEQNIKYLMKVKSEINASYSQNDSKILMTQLPFVHKMYRAYYNNFWKNYTEKYISQLRPPQQSHFKNISQIKPKSQKSQNSHIIQKNLLKQINNHGQNNDSSFQLSREYKQKSVRQSKVSINQSQMKKKANNIQVIQINSKNVKQNNVQPIINQNLKDQLQLSRNVQQKQKSKTSLEIKDVNSLSKKGDNQELQEQGQIQQVINGPSYYTLIAQPSKDQFDVQTKLVTKSHLNEISNYIQIQKQKLSQSVIVSSAQVIDDSLRNLSVEQSTGCEKPKQQILVELRKQDQVQNKQIQQLISDQKVLIQQKQIVHHQQVFIQSKQEQQQVSCQKTFVQSQQNQQLIVRNQKKEDQLQDLNIINEQQQYIQVSNKQKIIKQQSYIHQESSQISREKIQQNDSIRQEQNNPQQSGLQQNIVQKQKQSSQQMSVPHQEVATHQKQSQDTQNDCQYFLNQSYQICQEAVQQKLKCQQGSKNVDLGLKDQASCQPNKAQDLNQIQQIQKQSQSLDSKIQIIVNDFFNFLHTQDSPCQICLQKQLENQNLRGIISQLNETKQSLQIVNVSSSKKILQLEQRIKLLEQKLQKQQIQKGKHQEDKINIINSLSDQTKNLQQQKSLEKQSQSSQSQDQSQKNSSELQSQHQKRQSQIQDQKTTLCQNQQNDN